MLPEGRILERALLIALLVLVGVGGFVLLKKEDDSQSLGTKGLPSADEQELILLRAENRMLKSMLGQVDGQVVLLGPTSSGRKGYAKVVWDETLQSGYFYATQLPVVSQSEVYQLSMGLPGKPLVKCCTFSPDEEGRVQLSFSPAVRLLGVNDFVVTVEKGTGVNPPRGDHVLEGRQK